MMINRIISRGSSKWAAGLLASLILLQSAGANPDPDEADSQPPVPPGSIFKEVGPEAPKGKGPPCPPPTFFLRNNTGQQSVIHFVCSGQGATFDVLPGNMTWIWGPSCQPRPGVECKGEPSCSIVLMIDGVGACVLYDCFKGIWAPTDGLGEVPVGFVLTEKDVEAVTDLHKRAPRLSDGSPGAGTLYCVKTAEKDEQGKWRLRHNYVIGKPRIAQSDHGLQVVENAVVSFEVAE